jgi:hypothetical protein
MSELRDFVAEMLERHGAAVEIVEPDGLEALAPEPLRGAMDWQEFVRLSFGSRRSQDSIPIGLEGDWLDRFGALLGEHGRFSERQITLPGGIGAPGDPQRILDHALDLPNAVWRLHSTKATFTRCLVMAFRYTAISDEKREGLIWIAFNLATGAAIDEIAAGLRGLLAQEQNWQAPEPEIRVAAGPGWDPAVLQSRVRPLLNHRIAQDLGPFLQAMRRRLERDRNRVHAYHDELRTVSLKRLAALSLGGEKQSQADRQRETLRVAAIEREYRAKLDDLRHNYALRITVQWVQTLELYLPVHRFEVLIRRRKGERLIRLDWHPLVRMTERLVCDQKLHLTQPAGQAPCPSCAKAWCRACYPTRCPGCGQAV